MAHLRIGEDHPRLAATGHGVAQAFWAVAAGVIVAYVFFLALGAYDSGEVPFVTVAVLALAVLWVVHAVLVARRAARDARGVRRARERRGF